ncbi:MAG: hypothetical protein JXR39_11380 [Marinilabiliaceae bacterium]|nr:hypothetical protein [Marinilabiliaceae bacterium]
MQYLKSVENKVVFQKVYEFSGDAKSGMIRLFKGGTFTNIDSISARIENFHIDNKKYTTSMLPTYMRGNWNGNVIVDFKEGKYRVTVTNIQNLTPLTYHLGNVASEASHVNVETLVLKPDGTFRTSHEDAMIVLSRALNDLFKIPEQTLTDDW